MAITATTGATANLAVAATSLAFAANTLTNGQLVVVCVAIAGTATVSSISDGANTYTFQSGVTNGSAVRSEIWTAPITASTASRTITINFSGSTLASAAYEEYAGSSGLGAVATATTGTGQLAEIDANTQDNGSFIITSVAAATSSGDTFTQTDGTKRQSVVPALTTAGVALLENGGIQIIGKLINILTISTSRAWAATALELRTGTTAATSIPSKPYVPLKFNPNYVASRLIRSVIVGAQFTVNTLPNGVVNVPYSAAITTTAPSTVKSFYITSGKLPNGLTLNSSTGVVSGTPTLVGNYSFGVIVQDTFGLGQLYDFAISVTSAPGGSFLFIG